MDQTYEAQQFKNPGYEFFITSISILSIANIILIFFTQDEVMDDVVLTINLVISIFLIVDFLYRLLSSTSKRAYFIKDFGWLDLLGSLPVYGFQVFRLFRIIRILRIFSEMGSREVSREIRHERAASAMATVAFLVILVLQLGSYFIVAVEEGSPGANINTSIDALWWAFVTITTVGFGDQYPVTITGRIIGTLVIATGVVLFTVLTGFIASRFYTAKGIGGEDRAYQEKTDLSAIRILLEEQSHSLHVLQDQINSLQSQIDNKESE